MVFQIKRLSGDDQALIHQVLDCFSTVFDDVETYGTNRPDRAYLTSLLASDSFICLAAMQGDELAGALVGYELKKFEQPRSEMYIYDLAVYPQFRRQGVATGLIESLKPIARAVGAWVIYVQADYADEPAVQLYTKLGVREDVLHFDIPL
ncbi:AAC(3)-I family aminoglycoside N-acetyltransferase [Reinekea sp. G2M2-21]|uniref:AAC(3)-I family aminoglycoside N-acetyltransferase n=1 Tax=Reinekea sp. G2M2-21 TaxID=2788942 RepID=UPI0018AA51EC|nr:AAC(3)-I family aminoglycoside N-acetyltransferase [Reinekea sp. G2M2-21]